VPLHDGSRQPCELEADVVLLAAPIVADEAFDPQSREQPMHRARGHLQGRAQFPNPPFILAIDERTQGRQRFRDGCNRLRRRDFS
jgi:hypothetical protein